MLPSVFVLFYLHLRVVARILFKTLFFLMHMYLCVCVCSGRHEYAGAFKDQS